MLRSGSELYYRYFNSLWACSLRSSGGALLTVPKLRLKTRGDYAFTMRAPRIWNALPEEIRLAGSVNSFKSLLKTHFYRLAFMWCGPCVSIFTLSLSLVFVLFYLLCFCYFAYFIYFYLFCLTHFTNFESSPLLFQPFHASDFIVLCNCKLLFCFVCRSTL